MYRKLAGLVLVGAMLAPAYAGAVTEEVFKVKCRRPGTWSATSARVLRVVAKVRAAALMPCWWAAWTVLIQKVHGLSKSR